MAGQVVRTATAADMARGIIGTAAPADVTRRVVGAATTANMPGSIIGAATMAHMADRIIRPATRHGDVRSGHGGDGGSGDERKPDNIAHANFSRLKASRLADSNKTPDVAPYSRPTKKIFRDAWQS